MAPKQTTQVSANLDPTLYAFVDDIKWELKLKTSDIVRQALEDWAKAHGYTEKVEQDEAQVEQLTAPDKGRPATKA